MDEQQTPKDEPNIPNEETDEPAQTAGTSVEEPEVTRAVEPGTEQAAETDETEEKADTGEPVGKHHRLKTFFRKYWSKKRWTLPLTIVILLALLLGIPI